MKERIKYLQNKLEKIEYFYGAYPRTQWPADWFRAERETKEELEALLASGSQGGDKRRTRAR